MKQTIMNCSQKLDKKTLKKQFIFHLMDRSGRLNNE
jgi:hypothetical protein